jgi:hypothetical protein
MGAIGKDYHVAQMPAIQISRGLQPYPQSTLIGEFLNHHPSFANVRKPSFPSIDRLYHPNR